MSKSTAIKVLIPGRLHPRCAEQLSKHFTVIHEATVADAVARPDAGEIRAIASFSEVRAPMIDRLPALEIISNFGVGYDLVDAAHAAKRGILVTHTPDVLNEEVADTALGLLLNTLRRFHHADAWLRAGQWPVEGNYPLTPLTLRGRTVGIAGLGRIGKAIGRRLEGFGVEIRYHNRRRDDAVAYPYHDTLTGLAEAVDTLISVLPAMADTLHCCNSAVFEALGPSGVFINVGRGATVNEDDLVAALETGVIAAAGLDVFEDEPNVRERLIALPNTCLLPHVGSSSVATRAAMADLVAANIIRHFEDGTVLTPVPECQGFARRTEALA